jgi:hypothetical protein
MRVDPARIQPPFRITPEPSHFALTTVREPSVEKLLAAVEAAQRSETDQNEALLVSRRGQNFFESSHPIAPNPAKMYQARYNSGSYQTIIAELRALRSRCSARFRNNKGISRWL